jgi:hypothetical protein
MRNLIIAGTMLMSGMVASSPLLAQTSSDEVAQLKQRVALLEKQVQGMSQIIEPLKAQQAAEGRRKAFRDRFEKKMAQDQAKYTREQLREAEQLYQVANQNWGSTEANESLQNMIKKYPDINRTGCAVLYVAQRSSGDERANFLKQCIEKHNDCFYGDGVQVGACARLLLAEDYNTKGEQEKAAALYKEIRTDYADAIDHGGKLLVDSIKAESK